MNETPVCITCPQCGKIAMLILLPDLRYRCESCAAVWRRVPGGYVRVDPSAYTVQFGVDCEDEMPEDGEEIDE